MIPDFLIKMSQGKYRGVTVYSGTNDTGKQDSNNFWELVQWDGVYHDSGWEGNVFNWVGEGASWVYRFKLGPTSISFYSPFTEKNIHVSCITDKDYFGTYYSWQLCFNPFTIHVGSSTKIFSKIPNFMKIKVGDNLRMWYDAGYEFYKNGSTLDSGFKYAPTGYGQIADISLDAKAQEIRQKSDWKNGGNTADHLSNCFNNIKNELEEQLTKSIQTKPLGSVEFFENNDLKNTVFMSFIPETMFGKQNNGIKYIQKKKLEKVIESTINFLYPTKDNFKILDYSKLDDWYTICDQVHFCKWNEKDAVINNGPSYEKMKHRLFVANDSNWQNEGDLKNGPHVQINGANKLESENKEKFENNIFIFKTIFTKLSGDVACIYNAIEECEKHEGNPDKRKGDANSKFLKSIQNCNKKIDPLKTGCKIYVEKQRELERLTKARRIYVLPPSIKNKPIPSSEFQISNNNSHVLRDLRNLDYRNFRGYFESNANGERNNYNFASRHESDKEKDKRLPLRSPSKSYIKGRDFMFADTLAAFNSDQTNLFKPEIQPLILNEFQPNEMITPADLLGPLLDLIMAGLSKIMRTCFNNTCN